MFPLKQAEYERNTRLTYGEMKRELLERISNQYAEPKKTADFAFERTKGHCFYCGSKLYYVKNDNSYLLKNATLDHIIPVLHFGIIAKGNTALSCRSCNSEKNGSLAIDYYKERIALKQACYFDTIEQAKEELLNQVSIYQDEFPLMAKLSEASIAGSIDTISFEMILECAKENKSNKNQLMLEGDKLKVLANKQEKQIFIEENSVQNKTPLFNHYLSKINPLFQLDNAKKSSSFIAFFNSLPKHLNQFDFMDLDNLNGEAVLSSLSSVPSGLQKEKIKLFKQIMTALSVSIDNKALNLNKQYYLSLKSRYKV